MAVDAAPVATRVRKTAVAIETTTGTLATLAAADAVTRFFEPTMTYNTEMVERPTNNVWPQGMQPGQRLASFTGGTELTAPTGAAALPKWTRLLQMAGFTPTSKVFTPSIPSIVTGSIGHYRSGRYRPLVGGCANGVLTLTRGQPGRWDWTVNGVQGVPDSSTSLSTITYEDLAPVYAGATVSLGSGTTLIMPSIVIDLGNVIAVRDDVGAVDSAGNPTGARSCYITAVNPRVRMSPEAKSLSDRDWYAGLRNQTEYACTITMGGGATGAAKCVITLPKLRLISDPGESDDNGMLRDDLEFLPVGDDSTSYMTIDLTPAT